MGCEESAADTVVEDILAEFPPVGGRIRILDVTNSRLLRKTTTDLVDGLDMAGKKETKRNEGRPLLTRGSRRLHGLPASARCDGLSVNPGSERTARSLIICSAALLFCLLAAWFGPYEPPLCIASACKPLGFCIAPCLRLWVIFLFFFFLPSYISAR